MKVALSQNLLGRLILIAWMVMCFSGVGRLPLASAKATLKGDAYQVIALVNQVRASYGLPALQAHSALMAAAQGHSDYQASIGTATHSGKGGSSPSQRAIAAGYGGGAKVYVSENIYSGNHASPSQAVNWWTGDGIHLQTMINPNATDAGVGVAQNGDTVYYTLLVGYVAGSPGSGAVPAPAAGGTKAPTAAPFIPVVTSTPNPDGSIVHVVQPGQALWNIAAVYNVPLADLLTLNGLNENSFIFPGDKLLIRKAEITPTIEQTLLPTASPTPTVLPHTPTLRAISLDKTVATPTQVVWQPGDVSRTANDQVEQLPQPRAETAINFFPLLIGGLFFAGGALILLGTLARPRR